MAKGQELVNVAMLVEDDILTIKINLSERHGLAKSGKSVTIASTDGFAPIPDHDGMWLRLMVNARR